MFAFVLFFINAIHQPYRRATNVLHRLKRDGIISYSVGASIAHAYYTSHIWHRFCLVRTYFPSFKTVYRHYLSVAHSQPSDERRATCKLPLCS